MGYNLHNMVIVVLRPCGSGNRHLDLGIPDNDCIGVAYIEASPHTGEAETRLDEAGGLYIAGDVGTGESNGDSQTRLSGSDGLPNWRKAHRDILIESLELDMPILATGAGMLLLNEVFGGELPVDRSVRPSGYQARGADKERRTIYISPGSKTAAILGSGGFFRVNARDADNLLFDAQRAPSLLASAYSVEDGSLEGLESPSHSWVIGFRANVNREADAPKAFSNIFQAFFERAQDFAESRNAAWAALGPATGP